MMVIWWCRGWHMWSQVCLCGRGWWSCRRRYKTWWRRTVFKIVYGGKSETLIWQVYRLCYNNGVDVYCSAQSNMCCRHMKCYIWHHSMHRCVKFWARNGTENIGNCCWIEPCPPLHLHGIFSPPHLSSSLNGYASELLVIECNYTFIVEGSLGQFRDRKWTTFRLKTYGIF